MKLFLRSTLFVSCFLGFLLNASIISAASSIYLTPASRTVYQGVNFTIAIRMSSGGESINAVQANLIYPTDKLDFVGISKGGSAFNIDAPSGGGGGSISISRGIIGAGVSGDKLIASVTFRPKVSSGAANVTVGSDSALVRGSDQANVISGRSGGVYTLAPASEVPTPTPNTTPELTVTDIKITNLSYNTATVEWKTNRNATSIVEFGLSPAYGFIAQSNNASTSHSVSLNSELLSLGTQYYYRVKSVDEDTQEVASEAQTFKTNGIDLLVKVASEKGNILAKQEITLVTPQGPLKATTDETGIARFKDLAPITYTVLVGRNGSNNVSIVSVSAPSDEVIKKGAPIEQVANVQVTSASYSTYLALVVTLVVILLVIAAGVIKLKRKRDINKIPEQFNL